MIPAGKLTKTVDVQRATFIDNEFGEPVETWGVIKSTRASVRPVTGNEQFLVGLKNEVSHKIDMRFIPQLNLLPSDRIVDVNRVYEIEYILDYNERHQNIQILAKEKYYD